ncbi:MAG: tryptophan synthase subunit alpha [Nitrospirales bacterium]|nr:tryptophan synthase subunit alpha [Nitrospira sp.]MDR4502910.1 tryptophan synthase subunit alpha [Nitrospirales bacterium]
MSNRIQTAFSALNKKDEKALIPYIMAGDPTMAVTETLVLELEQAGADLIELGVPFSDPIADGPVIQKAAERALRSGTSLNSILTSVKSLRAKTQIPLILMTYYNTIMAMGEEKFCARCVEAGIDGVIVPDMPPEESDILCQASEKFGGPTVIFLLAPTSTKSRQKDVITRTQGFIYYVSLTGITGAQIRDMQHVQENVQKIQKASKQPVAVGFGISTPEHVQEVSRFADGVIIGSALVRHIGTYQDRPDSLEKIRQFVSELKHNTCRH